jgi:hypothetical protein
LTKGLNIEVVKGIFGKMDMCNRSIISFKNLDDFKAANKTGKDYPLEFMEYLLESNDGYVSLYIHYYIVPYSMIV